MSERRATVTGGDVGKLVEVRYADGSLRAMGVVYSYQAEPSIMLCLPDGSKLLWPAAFCCVVPMAQDAVEEMETLFRGSKLVGSALSGKGPR